MSGAEGRRAGEKRKVVPSGSAETRLSCWKLERLSSWGRLCGGVFEGWLLSFLVGTCFWGVLNWGPGRSGGAALLLPFLLLSSCALLADHSATAPPLARHSPAPRPTPRPPDPACPPLSPPSSFPPAATTHAPLRHLGLCPAPSALSTRTPRSPVAPSTALSLPELKTSNVLSINSHCPKNCQFMIKL